MFRKVSLILGMVALLEIAAILFTPTYEKELAEARRAYEQAWTEYVTLVNAQHQF